MRVFVCVSAECVTVTAQPKGFQDAKARERLTRELFDGGRPARGTANREPARARGRS